MLILFMPAIAVREPVKTEESIPFKTGSQIKEYHHGDQIDKDKAEEIIPLELRNKILESLEIGETMVIGGSSAVLPFWNVAPVIFSEVDGSRASDFDLIHFGKKGLARFHNPERRYKIKKGVVEESGREYEIVDGFLIMEDISLLTEDIGKQLVREFNKMEKKGEFTITEDELMHLKFQISKVYLASTENQDDGQPNPAFSPYTTLLSDILINQLGVGILVTKTEEDELNYRFLDPDLTHDAAFSGNDLFQVWNNQMKFAGGVLSAGTGEANIHLLTMDMVRLFGHVETNVLRSLNTLRLALRLPRDSSIGFTIAADGIWDKWFGRFHPATGDWLKGRATEGLHNFRRVKDFLQTAARGIPYTTVDEETIKKRKVDSYQEYAKRAVDSEFARASFVDPADAIFYFFSYFEIGDTVLPEVDEMLTGYKQAFKGVYQNTLRDNIDLKSLDELPQDVLKEGADGLAFFQNVAHVCEQLYPAVWALDYGGKGESVDTLSELQEKDREQLAVIRRRNPPESISEVFAVMLHCAGRTDILNDPQELTKIADRWTKGIELHPFFDNAPIEFDANLSAEGISKAYETKVKNTGLIV